MSQEDSSTSSHPFFPVTGKVTFKPMTAGPERAVGSLRPGVARLVTLVSLSAAVLWPMSGCGTGEGNVPCPVPTPRPAGTLVPAGTPTASCTTSGGTHYLWIHSLGGWVESDDGIHPKSNAHGVGVDEGHSGSGVDEGHGGVGDGHGGGGHGGGEGG